MPDPLLILAWSMPDPSGALLTAFGIGLVIFVHEFGHFLCARAVGVDVEVFSLGFGPRLCGVVIRGTDYRISGVPLGGYVKVRGDQPGDDDPHPGSYSSKSIGAKFLVRAGGVIANLLFAIAVFPMTFGAGVDMDAPILGRVDPGGPGWRAGLRPGDEVLEVDGRPIHSFTDVFLEVALADPDGVPIAVRRDGQEISLVARPEYSNALGTYALRVEQAITPRIRVLPGGVAERAGLRSGESVIAVDGVTATETFADLLATPDGQSVKLRVRGEDGTEREVVLEPEWQTNERANLVGIGPVMLEVTAVREAFARADARLRIGDRVLAAGGRPVFDDSDLARAMANVPSGARLSVSVARGDATFELAFSEAELRALRDGVAFGPVLGAGSEGRSGVPIVVSRGSSADRAGLRNGDRVLRIDGEATAEWKDALDRIRGSESGSLEIVVADAAGAERTVRVARGSVEDPLFGFGFEAATITRKYPFAQACGHGLYASWNMTRQVYLTLKKMVSRDVSTDNLGSIVSISVVSYHVAMEGLAKFFYFLAMLSINLAVINVLPIPILDGGFMMFLLIEKVTGAPISDRVMGYSQLVGLAFLFALLIYVIKKDIERLIGG